MFNFATAFPGSLSGTYESHVVRILPIDVYLEGQQRKLCVAIAYVGEPLLIFLDEPTSGVDAYARRQVWALCRKLQLGRVVIYRIFMDYIFH